MQKVISEKKEFKDKVILTLGIKGVGKTSLSRLALSLDSLIRGGFTMQESNHAKATLGLKDEELASTLGISTRTLQRKKKHRERLSAVESDRLYRIVRIFAIASQVFEDDGLANEWLRKPQTSLGNTTPFVMLQTEAGSREVEDLLGRLQHSVLS